MSGITSPAPAHWPGADVASCTACRVQYPAGRVDLVQPDPASLTQAIAAVRRARRHIEDRPAHEIIAALDACAAAWCEPQNTYREQAIEWLGATTGCARGMLGPALTATFAALRAPHLTRLLAHELGGTEALDGGIEKNGVRLRALGPRLTWLIGGGIVPNAIATPLFAALLCKSAVLVKCPSREPTFGALLAQSLAALDPKLGACVAAGWWAGGTGALDSVAAAAADTVIATGTDATLEAVRTRLGRRTRLVAYGDRVSVIGIGRERLTPDFANLMWMQLAEAVCWYEQQGCLSPHILYIEEGGELSPHQAAERLGDAMALYESKAPRGPVSDEVAAALRAHRDRAEVKAVDTARAGVWVSAQQDPAWIVVYDSDPAFQRSPGYRFIHVKPVYDLEDLPAILAKSDERFQAVGLELDDARRPALAEAFAELGVSRVCTAADLQKPPVDWPRDGRAVVASLVRWVQV